MGNTTAVKRTFVVEAGMKPQDVIRSSLATEQQKRLAHIFDADGIEGYSQREANIFNATTITDKGEKGVTLWTTFADGSKKATNVSNDMLPDYKYSPDGEVNHTKMKMTPEQLEEKYKGKGRLEYEYYPNGQLKQEKLYHTNTYDSRGVIKEVKYKQNGDTISYKSKDGGNLHSYWVDTEKDYYENGKVHNVSRTEVHRWTSSSDPTTIEYDMRGDTIKYYSSKKMGLGAEIHVIEKYAGGRARFENKKYAGYGFSEDVSINKATFDGKPVKYIKDIGKGYCKVTSKDGTESYYNKDGIKLTKEYVEKQTQGWFMDLVDNVKSWF